tara:strand:+ start:2185 stop:2418 length:234 start_codon:yes stop_codon:yes gene_type:complete
MEEPKSIATFRINGRETQWRMGWGLGEPVYHALEDSLHFRKDQRVCWELMQDLMDQVHREEKEPDYVPSVSEEYNRN